MKEKTLRWPGHAELMRVLRDTGFFSLEPIDVGGQKVRPRDVTAALLFPRWTFEEGEADLTVMRVRVVGPGERGAGRLRLGLRGPLPRGDGAAQHVALDRLRRHVVARLVARGGFRRPGVHPPETLGAVPGILDGVLADLDRARRPLPGHGDPSRRLRPGQGGAGVVPARSGRPGGSRAKNTRAS